jgi:hypothetical protein
MFRSGCASVKFAEFLNEQTGISGLNKVFSYWGNAQFIPTDFVGGRIRMLEQNLAAEIQERASFVGEVDRLFLLVRLITIDLSDCVLCIDSNRRELLLDILGEKYLEDYLDSSYYMDLTNFLETLKFGFDIGTTKDGFADWLHSLLAVSQLLPISSILVRNDGNKFPFLFTNGAFSDMLGWDASDVLSQDISWLWSGGNAVADATERDQYEVETLVLAEMREANEVYATVPVLTKNRQHKRLYICLKPLFER